MKKHVKALFVLLLVVFVLGAACMVIGAKENNTCVNANGVDYATFQEAFDAISDVGGKITLKSDVVLDSEYYVSNDLEIDLAGYTMYAQYGTFLFADGANFTLSGSGTIYSEETFIKNTTAATDSTVINVVGTNGPIYVYFDGVSGTPFTYTNGAAVNFKNVEIRTGNVKTGETVFYTMDNSRGTLSFTNVNLIGENHLGQNSSVIELRGDSLVKIKDSSFVSNTAVFSVATKTLATIVEAENSQFINRATSGTDRANETGVIGIYSEFFSKMYFKNSLIEGGYRPILLKGNANGLIHLDGSVLKYTGAKSSDPIRTSNISFTGGSSFIVGKKLSKLSDSSEYLSNIDFELGTRMSVYLYNLINEGKAPEIRVVANVEGKNGTYQVYTPFTANCDYEIIYDPTGNADAPYVLVDKYVREADGDIKLDEEGNPVLNDYVKTDIGNVIHNSTGASLPEGTIWQDQKYKFPFDTSAEFPQKTYITWNKPNGSIIGYKYGGNSALKYLRGSSTSQITLSLVTDGIKYNAHAVTIFEVDIATDSELGFSDGTINVNVRRADGSGGGANGAGVRLENGIAVPYGMTVPEDKADKTYPLETSAWHRITVVFYTDPSVEDKETTDNFGKAYYFLNGEFLGETYAYKKQAGLVYGLRYDSSKTAKDGSSLLFDNASVRTFDSYLGEGESLETHTPEAYLLNKGLAISSPVGSMGIFAVGGLRYDTLDEALAAADSKGGYVTLLGDVTTPVKISTACTIFANGYKMSLTDDSLAAKVDINDDGSNYSYMFSPLFEDLKVEYEWFTGDINNVDELKDPSKYVKTKVCLGEIPGYVGSEFVVEEKYYIGLDGIYDYSHVGWSRTIGAEEPEKLIPLTLSDAINHKDGAIKLFPVFGYTKRAGGYTWAVTDENGALLYNTSTNSNGEIIYTLRAGTQTGTQYSSFWTNTVKLGSGEIFHMFADLSVASNIRLVDAVDVTKPYGFNLNGHKLSIDAYKQNYGYGNRIEGVFGVSANCTLNVYSAYEGAEITSIGYNKIKTTFYATPNHDTIDHSQNDYSLTGGVLFRLNANNAKINVGTVQVGDKEYSGNNLSAKGDCLAWIVGGENAAINIDGINYVRTTSKYNAVVMTRDTNGAINVKNSTVILAAGGALLGNQVEGDDDSATITVKDSVIVMEKNGDNAVFRNEGGNTVVIENCVTNANLNAGANTVSGVGTAAYSSAFTALPGAYNAKADIAMTLSDTETVTVYTYNKSNEYGNFTTYDFTVASNGSKAIANLKLPKLSVKTLGDDEVIKYTFEGLGTNPEQVFYYAPGTPVDLSVEIASCALNYVELTHNGKFDKKIPDIAEKSIVFKPLYTMKSKIEGIKTSVTLYTYFIFNLYIPAEYKSAISEIVYGGEALEYTEQTVDGVPYVKVKTPIIPTEAAEKLEFAIKITDSGYTGSTVVSTSVAEYAEAVMSNTEKYTAEEGKLVYTMLCYVSEASKYENVKAAPELEALIEAYASVYEEKGSLTPSLDGGSYKDERFVATSDNSIIKEAFVTAKVRLDSAPAYVFTLRRGFVGTVSIRYGFVSHEYKIEKPSDRTIVLDGMNAADFAKTLYISVSGEINGKSVEISGARYNLAAYLQYHAENVAEAGKEPTEAQFESERAVSLIKALLSYVAAADDYRESILEAPDESVDSSDEYVPEGDTPLGDVELD